MTPYHAAAAVALCAFITLSASSDAQTPNLRPDQKRAVEIVLMDIEPSMRPLMREQISKNLAPFSEQQIKMMLDGLAANGSKAAAAPQDEEIVAEGALSPEDFEYNRAQYEPAIRKSHAAQVAFDDFVEAKLAAHCPAKPFARWGSAWRYELIGLKSESATASNNADTDVAVLGASYAPQDGRHDFDFSKVRMTFDKAAVEAAIRTGCNAYKVEGEAFLAKLDPMIARQDWDAAFKLEQTSMGRIDPIRSKMDAALNAQSPSADYALFTALQNGKRVKTAKTVKTKG